MPLTLPGGDRDIRENPESGRLSMPIHPSANIDPTAQVPESNDIGPGVRIGPGCVLGENNVFMDGAVLGPNTRIGSENVFHYHSIVGHDPQYLGFDPKTKSGTIIGNKNHFREFSTVHRGLKDGLNTVIGNENFLMTTTHVAHDCELGNNIVMVNYSGISGHTIVEDRAFISGHVAGHQFIRIGKLAMVGGGAPLSKDVSPFMMVNHTGIVIGINTVGLRRAGVGAEARMALRKANEELFRSGRGVTKSLVIIREQWAGREMPPELKHLLDFCSVKSKRGLLRGPRAGEVKSVGGEEDDE